MSFLKYPGVNSTIQPAKAAYRFDLGMSDCEGERYQNLNSTEQLAHIQQ